MTAAMSSFSDKPRWSGWPLIIIDDRIQTSKAPQQQKKNAPGGSGYPRAVARYCARCVRDARRRRTRGADRLLADRCLDPPTPSASPARRALHLRVQGRRGRQLQIEAEYLPEKRDPLEQWAG